MLFRVRLFVNKNYLTFLIYSLINVHALAWCLALIQSWADARDLPLQRTCHRLLAHENVQTAENEENVT